MNATETIAAAIQKLTDLREAGSAGRDEWKVWGASSGIRSSADYEWIVFDDGDATSRYRIAEKQNWGTSADMQMIVTLHRTIDAQLAILDEGVRTVEQSYGNAITPSSARVVALARSILGGSS